MTKDELLIALQKEVEQYNKFTATDNGDWIVKGFIDIYKNVYTISIDTKVVSKVMEILLIPAFERFAQKNGLKLELPPQQNFYPDLTLLATRPEYDLLLTLKVLTERMKIISKTQ